MPSPLCITRDKGNPKIVHCVFTFKQYIYSFSHVAERFIHPLIKLLSSGPVSQHVGYAGRSQWVWIWPDPSLLPEGGLRDSGWLHSPKGTPGFKCFVTSHRQWQCPRKINFIKIKGVFLSYNKRVTQMAMCPVPSMYPPLICDVCVRIHVHTQLHYCNTHSFGHCSFPNNSLVVTKRTLLNSLGL